MDPEHEIKGNSYYFTDTSFKNLMKNRINHVLLICSKYDAFILEEDGRIDEQIFNEYVSLNLRYPPQFLQAHSAKVAFEIIEAERIDLVISMLSVKEEENFEISNSLKEKYPDIPIVVLTPFSRKVSLKLQAKKHDAIDYVFSWLGNSDLLLAIIKLIEDKMNMEYDVMNIGVQTILLVEDSVRYYSSYLPNIYKIIFKQSKQFQREGLNEHQKMLRMRGRPKILLATSYEQAIEFYQKYKNNMLGVISDMSYPRNGEQDPYAGIRLCKLIKQDDKYMPLLLQSSDLDNKNLAKQIRVGFIHKYSKTLSIELRRFITQYFAFGDFEVINPDTHEIITKASDLKSLQGIIYQIPDNAFSYHIQRNHFSKWLNARALFPIAEMFKHLRREDFEHLNDVRKYLFDTIACYRINKGRGIIAKFYRERFDEYFTFTRIGEGSIGGKARGLAFVDSLIKRNWILDKYENVLVTIPRTVVLSTDVFDEFMEENNLYPIALSDASDSEILSHFVNARLPVRIHEDLYKFVSVVRNPLAIRSSSLLEDSHYQPFAGIYSTYMLPNIKYDDALLIEKISDAIKSVYASVFYKASKAYMAATKNVIDEEKMGIVLQELCGKTYGDRFYPTISGVARSTNFYPIEPEKSTDGIANIALGLGKHIVEGEVNLRFSPRHPKRILQLATPESALKTTQKYFYALDMDIGKFSADINDGINIQRLRINEAEKDGSLDRIASTFDFQNNILRDGSHYEGKKVITFNNILQYNTFPLAEILSTLLEIGQNEMGTPVEIEFAVTLNSSNTKQSVFNVLQIRPIVDVQQNVEQNIENINPDNSIIYSKSALGNGCIQDVKDFVYVKPESFNPAKNPELAGIVEKINEKFVSEDKNYVLVGPGRWGSSDPWLGIPVKWSQISAARLIVESGLDDYRIDPSQGTHFFQNLTSFQVGYFTINPFMKDGLFDIDYLNSFDAVYEDEYLRHIQFEQPLKILIDGKKNLGVVLKHNAEFSEKNNSNS